MGMSTRIGRKVTVTTCTCVIVNGRDVEMRKWSFTEITMT